MNAIQALLLGALQGITEFLPVSSSGHLVLARALMDIRDIPILFDVILHVATLVVVIWVFRKRIGGILASLFRYATGRATDADRPYLILAGQLVAASVVTAVIGLAISRVEIREDPKVVSAFLLVTAVVLLSTLRSRGTREIDSIGWGRSLVMGAAQGLGVFPGVSRSGSTIASGLLCGLDRKTAGEFSFLLSLPAVGGAFLLTLKDAAELSESVPASSLAAGFVAALAVGYAALKLLLWLVAEGRLWIFAFYLVPVGICGLLFF